LAAGKAIKDIPREQVIIASKWGPMIDEGFNFTHDGSPAYARKSLQVSLKNLGVDYIDLYILRSTRDQGTEKPCNGLVRAGLGLAEPCKPGRAGSLALLSRAELCQPAELHSAQSSASERSPAGFAERCRRLNYARAELCSSGRILNPFM